MKKAGCLTKLIFAANTLVAFLLVVSFTLPYLAPSKFGVISLLSLTVSPLILANIIFCIWWLVQGNRRFFVSLVILIIAYFHFNPFFNISSEGNVEDYNKSIKLLSYNVRLFNAYENNVDTLKVQTAINQLLEKENPDVIFFQEFYRNFHFSFQEYPYKYIHFRKNGKLGHAILSKYKLINEGAFDFSETSNNTLYADLVKGEDTLRLYNVHLQSMSIIPNFEFLQENNKERLAGRMTSAFRKQEIQINEILKHQNNSPHPTIIGGDFNNTSFSYTYNQFASTFKDAFLKKGDGLGTTFLFERYPMRIDYIFTTKQFDVIDFETGKSSFSDHWPISAILAWDKKEN